MTDPNTPEPVAAVEELLPCPFCGGEVELMHDHTTEQVDYIRHKTFDPDCLNPNVNAFSCGNDTFVARWNHRLASTPSPLRGSAGEEGQLAIGTAVRCQIDNIEGEWRECWRDWSGFVAGATHCPVNGINYTVSDEWPPRYRSDGFAPNQLAALTPEPKEP